MTAGSKHFVIDMKDVKDDEKISNTDTYDKDFLHRTVEDAGRWAFGVILVELWVLNKEACHLYRPECGWWIDTYADKDNLFSVLTDPSLPDYIHAEPLAPGIGLPGYLWSQSKSVNPGDREVGRLSVLPGRRSETIAERSPDEVKKTGVQRVRSNEVSWCEVKPLAADPDQPYNKRLQYMAKAGLGLAAGVPFNIAGTRGIVVYMARATANRTDLTDDVNRDYLLRATMVIGSAYCLRAPRRAVVQKRKSEISNSWRRARVQISAISAMGMTLSEAIEDEMKKKQQLGDTAIVGDLDPSKGGACHTASKYFEGKCISEAKKFLGANVTAPPAFDFMSSFFTFAGSFLTLAALTYLNKSLISAYGPGYAIVLPPLGALMTLQYGLTAAPASQPRNAIMGQAVALCIAQLIGQLSDLELWLRQSLATSLAIGVMVKFGLTHPPAGAAALVFSSGTKSWRQVGLMILGNVIAILSATLINNWNEKRQYPTFWGFRPLVNLYAAKKKKEG